MSLSPIEIHLISDSTGDTAARVARAAQTQFSGHPTALIRHPRVTTLEGLHDAYSRVGRTHVAIFYTLVDRELRSELADLCRRDGLAGCDLLGPALDTLGVAAGREADLAPGRPIALDPDYFKRVAAMEFAVKHDDGMNGAGLAKADIVLIGVSRTGKTPLSMYLGYLGYMAANIPLVPGVKPPEELFTEVDRWKVVGLTIDAERLAQIRNRRLRAIAGRASGGDYAELNHIFDEIDEAAAIQRRLGCPVIDVTNTAIEESAQRVIELVESRRPH